MKLLRKYRYLSFAVLLIIAVNIIAFISFQKISIISDKITLTLKQSEPASLIAKQVMIELRSAENNAKSYYLSNERQNLDQYYKATYNLRLLLLELNTYKYKADKQIIDSISLYSKLLINKLKEQSYLKDQNKIISELDELSKKIDQIDIPQATPKEAPQSIEKSDPDKKKKGLFKRLFSKNNKVETPQNVAPIIVTKKSVIPKKEDIKGTLQGAISNTKTNQERIIEVNRKLEYENSRAIFFYREHITSLIDSLLLREDLRKISNARNANSELRKLKVFTVTSTSLLTVFLIVIVYFVLAYFKKRSEYTKMLIEARNEAENLAQSKVRFLNNMSHEIRTPLNAIQGFSELLAQAELKSEERQQITIIKNSASYLSKLINNILSNARLDSGKVKLNPVDVDIVNEIKEIVTMLQIQASNKGLSLNFDFTKLEVNFIKIDIEKFKQILFNLLGNAIKFTDKGSVTLQVENKGHDNPYLQIQFIDTGIGIAEEILPKLFQEFEQGSEQTQLKFGGTGLGLVITKKTVQQLGGSMEIKSKLNEGTSILVKVPYSKSTISSADSITKVDLDLSFMSNKRILLVDDEEYNRLLMRSLLNINGIRIVECTNGEEALSAFKKETYDLVIMDVRMPVMNGIEATIEIRKQDKKIPILGATALLNEEKIASCTNAGMDEIIFKPFSKADLAEKLSKIFASECKNNSDVSNKITVTQSSINVAALNESTQGDEAFNKELISVFHKSINTCVAEIHEFLKANDYSMVSEKAHKIIPSCKHMETHQLLVAMRFLEKLPELNEIDNVALAHHVKMMNEELNNINHTLQPYLD
ncbi:MAG TPA: response regulator [Bacteroidia bacterium]|nr:response regulator [Bacteroidia bacterium]